MKSARPVSDHHWLALWLLLVGAVWVTSVVPESTLGGVFMGAGFVWLMLVD